MPETACTTTTIQIAGTGSIVPEHVITTELIGSLVDRHIIGKGAVWAREKLGIVERRFMVQLDPVTGHPQAAVDELDLAARAAERALTSAGISAGDVGGLWLVSCTQPDTHRHFSRMALELHQGLGLPPASFALEMDAGCGGVVHALATAASQMRGSDLDRILVVASNAPSQYFQDWERYVETGSWLSMYLFGDGAGAVILHRAEPQQRRSGILATYTAVDPRQPLMQFDCPPGGRGPVYSIDGRGVALGFRVYAHAALEALQSRYPFQLHAIKRFYFHQVNGMVLRSFISELGIPDDRVPIHVDRYGNLAAAATLVLLDEDIRNGIVSSGDLCVICAVGAGAQYGAILFRM